jgi:hypothetical protein
VTTPDAEAETAGGIMGNLTPEEEARLVRLLKLAPDVIDRLEKVAKEDERMEWLWALVRRSAAGIAAVVGAFILFGEQIRDFIRFVVRGTGAGP